MSMLVYPIAYLQIVADSNNLRHLNKQTNAQTINANQLTLDEIGTSFLLHGRVSRLKISQEQMSKANIFSRKIICISQLK